MGKAFISIDEEIKIISLLLDHLYLIVKIKSGLCRLPQYFKSSHGDNFSYKMSIWLNFNLPKPYKYKEQLEYSNGYSWPPGDFDRRYYWLKMQLKLKQNEQIKTR